MIGSSMYAGQIVEAGPTAEAYDYPQHPYTQALISVTPQLIRTPIFRLPKFPALYQRKTAIEQAVCLPTAAGCALRSAVSR
ncbi:MAG: hypothetical protein ACLSA6_02785 [Holdemania massiliensis]